MKKITIAAVVAIASQAFAEPLPYRPAKAFLSAREIFGLDRRDTDVYHPKQSCGASFAQCASTDNQMHCYDSGANEACCPDGSGNSCEAGYYCAADTAGQTVCCPEGTDLTTCASKYSVAGGLHFETKVSSSTASSTSTAAASSSASSSAVTSTPASPTGGIFFESGNSTSAGAASGTGTGGSGSATKTTGAAGSSTASATGSTTNGAGVASPASFLALLGVAGLAALL
ncbi:hypothetical protein INS49_000616 [Diaporthe citri]|uniref:uncharacterized protein n=1 Tax=Diaporthe citri TaxID=83186 RepID=UPI001C813E77|nr:uncharacterized protein INS49_000616 [Diaporthe citri]KAG6366439.1 hypothetical protein INS49_000616 [Diaporthe citri]